MHPLHTFVYKTCVCFFANQLSILAANESTQNPVEFYAVLFQTRWFLKSNKKLSL